MSELIVGDESLGQCEARHWAFGRCHYVPHDPSINHWIEDEYRPGTGLTFTDATAQSSKGPFIVCEDVNTARTVSAAGDGT